MSEHTLDLSKLTLNNRDIINMARHFSALPDARSKPWIIPKECFVCQECGKRLLDTEVEEAGSSVAGHMVYEGRHWVWKQNDGRPSRPSTSIPCGPVIRMSVVATWNGE